MLAHLLAHASEREKVEEEIRLLFGEAFLRQ